MPTVKAPQNTIIIERPVKAAEPACYHCGTACITDKLAIGDKYFCCEGCKLVYEILDQNGLCDYYRLQNHPGLSQLKSVRNEKFAYLDNEEIAKKLYKFTDGNNVIVLLYIPGVHCSSCMWLLEHMQKINPDITESRLNFSTKELTVRFRLDKVSLRQVVELLATIGYEPYISLDDAYRKKGGSANKKLVYKLGVAGFCFGNIMMLSFPEYLSINTGIEHQYAGLFRIMAFVLSLPVFFYSASEFYVSAWKGLKQRMLNIDAPIVLALAITYGRSIYEIATGTGSGFLDSMSGIVFFMLVGRIVQERTYRSLSFHRDYKAYFPIAVNVVTPSGVISKALHDLREKDVVQLFNDEIVPADSVVVKGRARIDYSFVTGESEPVSVPEGAMLYAGGMQVGEQLTIQVVKPVAGSYLTSLWNHYSFSGNKARRDMDNSIIHRLARYFTYILLALAALTAIYWQINDPEKILPSVSAMLIVACPCALLLSATYTNGNLLRILSNNGLFLRDASVIEQLGKTDHIVFDKTGTLTKGAIAAVVSGAELTDPEKDMVYSVVRSSRHPYSKALEQYTGQRQPMDISFWKETGGEGLEAYIGIDRIRVGSASLVGADVVVNDAQVYVRINDKITGFHIAPEFREQIEPVMEDLKAGYSLSLLSGDNDRQRQELQKLLGIGSQLHFEQKPEDKLHNIEQLQEQGRKVLMIGDGLNDAGALRQSNVGITLADDINNFTPACDAILDAAKFASLPSLLKLARDGRSIINFSFIISIIYNVIGLYISVRGEMNPMIAAILMPVSTLSIVLITTGASSLVAKSRGLTLGKRRPGAK